MKKKAKNRHRSLFGRFRQFMEYKAEKFGKTLIIADRFYMDGLRESGVSTPG